MVEHSEQGAPAGTGVKFVFLELTNHCNFDCTFCPTGVMRRPRVFMDRALALRLLGEIADTHMAEEPIQLHVMGEPLLHPHLFEILAFMRTRGLPVRLFTNGALLDERNRARLYEAGIQELVIGVQVSSEDAYRQHRRGRPDYATYMGRIRVAIEEKFARRSATRIALQFMNTKHFNTFRAGKGYAAGLLPLVSDNGQALAILDEWKAFGRAVSAKYALGHEPIDLEGLQGVYRDDPLACVRGNHCEFLPGVVLSFKELNTFSDYLLHSIRFVERFGSNCNAVDEQLAVLANGECTLCCVDYDGRMSVGNVTNRSLESVWRSGETRAIQESNALGLFATDICRVCRAFQVTDDYAARFPGREREPFDLERGWYPLESGEDGTFRWIGKRARLDLHGDAEAVDLVVRHANPTAAATELEVRQGRARSLYRLGTDTWTAIRFAPRPVADEGRSIVIESDRFWVPARAFSGCEDRRELSVMIKDLTVT